MTLVTYTTPGGRVGTYETKGGDPERVKELTSLLCLSITEDGTEEDHRDNLFQAAACLAAEMKDLGPFASDFQRICHADAVANALAEFVDGGPA